MTRPKPDHYPKLPSNVVPLREFIEVERLMRKLGLSPADCLQLLHEVLGDLDRQIDEHEAERDAPPFPLAFFDERP